MGSLLPRPLQTNERQGIKGDGSCFPLLGNTVSVVMVARGNVTDTVTVFILISLTGGIANPFLIFIQVSLISSTCNVVGNT